MFIIEASPWMELEREGSSLVKPNIWTQIIISTDAQLYRMCAADLFFTLQNRKWYWLKTYYPSKCPAMNPKDCSYSIHSIERFVYNAFEWVSSRVSQHYMSVLQYERYSKKFRTSFKSTQLELMALRIAWPSENIV